MRLAILSFLTAVVSVLTAVPVLAQTGPGLRPVPASALRQVDSGDRSPEARAAALLLLAQKTDAPRSQRARHQFFSPSSPDRRRSEKFERYNEVQDALTNLLEEWEQTQSTKSDSPAGNEPPTSTDSGEWAPLERPDPSADADMATESDDSSQDQPKSPQISDEDLLAKLNAPAGALVDGPVDRIALADNLYAMGEYTLAMEIYNRVVMSEETPEQQFWVQFQNASCLRQLGDLNQARSQLRILAGQERDAGWLAHSARWWLDIIEDRIELEQELAEMQGRIAARKEKYREPKNR